MRSNEVDLPRVTLDVYLTNPTLVTASRCQEVDFNTPHSEEWSKGVIRSRSYSRDP